MNSFLVRHPATKAAACSPKLCPSTPAIGIRHAFSNSIWRMRITSYTNKMEHLKTIRMETFMKSNDKISHYDKPTCKHCTVARPIKRFFGSSNSFKSS